MAFHPRGALLATAGEGEYGLMLWDAATGETTGRFKNPAGWEIIPSVSFSSDARLIAAVGSVQGIRIYEHRKVGGSPIRYSFSPTARGLIREARFTSDGQHLVTLNSNGTVYVLRLPAGVVDK
jgi:WD40 repeat protein